VKTDFEKRAPAVAQRLAEEFDAPLQLAAEAKGWETPIHLEAKKGKLNLTYDRMHKSALFDSEYGNEDQSPNAVIRPFVNAIEPDISAEIQAEALNYLFEIGVLP
jgi:hypothetical protein